MPNIEKQFEKAERDLDAALEAGHISATEHRLEMRQLQREWREAAHEAAQRAYDREMDEW